MYLLTFLKKWVFARMGVTKTMANAEQLTFEKLFDILRTEKSNVALQRLPDSFYDDVIGYLEAKTALVKQDAEIGDFDMAMQQLRNARKVVQEIYDRREKKIISLALSKSRTADSVTDTSSMLEEELQFYTSVVQLFSEYRVGILQEILALKRPFGSAAKVIVAEDYSDPDDEEGDIDTSSMDAENATQKRNDEQKARHEAAKAAEYESNSKDGESTEQNSAAASEPPTDVVMGKYAAISDIPEFMGPDMLMHGPFKAGTTLDLPVEVAEMLKSNGQIKEV